MIQSSYTYANAAIDTDPNVLQDIHAASKNIAIYQRNIALLKNELHQLATQTIECRASGTIDNVLGKVQAYLVSTSGAYPFLLDDISELLGLFQKVTKASTFRLLLSTVSTNMCRKFHSDINNLRMLCTYIGPGTRWIPDEAIDLDAMARKEDTAIDLQKVQQAGTGEVVVLKGALYPGANPILHRSPTIEEKGERRLLLRIDTNESLNLFG
ncbi:MAG: DUF1826 domain-containing protein [Bacteroidota bacterium]